MSSTHGRRNTFAVVVVVVVSVHLLLLLLTLEWLRASGLVVQGGIVFPKPAACWVSLDANSMWRVACWVSYDTNSMWRESEVGGFMAQQFCKQFRRLW